MANCPTASVPYVGMLETGIPFAFAASTSTTLKPVARTPINLRLEALSIVFALIGVLLV